MAYKAPLLHVIGQAFDIASQGPHSTPVGTTKNTGTPAVSVRRRVRLHDQPTGRLVRETWSDPTTGAYQFTGLPAGRYFVVGLDHTLQYGGEIASDVVVPSP